MSAEPLKDWFENHRGDDIAIVISPQAEGAGDQPGYDVGIRVAGSYAEHEDARAQAEVVRKQLEELGLKVRIID